MRKSMKYKNKWTYCFFYLDINLFMKQGLILLKSFRPLKTVIDCDIMTELGPHLKRFKIAEQIHILLIPTNV